jgi:hypothetical protein
MTRLRLVCKRNHVIAVKGEARRMQELTWLILPVVIRLSQRLSHACLSINKFVLWNCEWLIISVIVYLIVPYYLDNRSNSRANTCVNTQLLVGRVAFIRLKPMRLRPVLCWVIITVRIASQQYINWVSALSALDGRIWAYHGVNG